ncbi:pentatricopeptide repeat-containing protein, chloroplastic [Nicotiana attenuata]|uniref:Pentatricopeptide repeat-containing protein, chloroplastic n=1 Tax=Nicotiana attenuata TaxID=49451 RepID=A0A1J6JQ41_NICAT|nr:pentatricopeptide repeat-containing protein, chloroplastic [Nicotiana attenuata]
MTLPFSYSGSVQFTSSTTTTPTFQQPKLTHNPWLNFTYKRPVFYVIRCVSTRPGRKSGTMSRIGSSEAQELVTLLMKNFSDKKPLVSTLNKYVKFVRTEHCFLLFEELGKTDNWLQCLEELVQKLLTCMDKDGIIPNKKFFLDALGAFGTGPISQKAAGDNKGLNKQRGRK